MNVSPAMAGVLSAIVVAANILGNLAAGLLLGRGTARWKPMALASIVMGLSGVAIFLLPLPALLILLLCLIFSSVGGLLPAAALTSAPLLAPVPQLAAMVQGSNLGQVVAPVVIGTAVDRAGWAGAAWPVAIAAAAALALTFLLRRFPAMTR
jgi:MFS family permease